MHVTFIHNAECVPLADIYVHNNNAWQTGASGTKIKFVVVVVVALVDHHNISKIRHGTAVAGVSRDTGV